MERQIDIAENASPYRVNAEERLPLSIWLNAHQGRWLLDRRLLAEQAGQLGDRGVLEQHGQRKSMPKLLLNIRYQTHRQQRVAAKIKEVIQHSDIRDAQDSLPDLCK